MEVGAGPCTVRSKLCILVRGGGCTEWVGLGHSTGTPRGQTDMTENIRLATWWAVINTFSLGVSRTVTSFDFLCNE